MHARSTDTPGAHAKRKETAKESVIGFLISFAVVLIFRGFFFESFHIPTGSMAPTLRGAHMQFQSPQSGFDWAVNPWEPMDGGPPAPIQGTREPVRPVDPVTLIGLPPDRFRLRAGDRIGILDYNPLFRPKRWDVFVFKNPEIPTENYIKRLIGLPGEDLWLVDGDVFTRRPTPSGDMGAWRIARKPVRIQRDLWWPVYSSEFAPLRPVVDGREWRGNPWQGEGWRTEGRVYEAAEGAGPLVWDTDARPITDFTWYNQTPAMPYIPKYPISDLRVRAGVEAVGALGEADLRIETRGRVFRALMTGSGASIQWAPAEGGAWETLAESGRPGLNGRLTEIEFWHVDQALRLFINGREVASAEYDWSPEERLARATVLEEDQLATVLADPQNVSLADPRLYRQPRVSMAFNGPVRLHRVGVDRDIHYHPQSRDVPFPVIAASPPSAVKRGTPSLGAHPLHLAELDGDLYFAAGDNSGNSRDSRLWDRVDPSVAHQFDPPVGLVPGDALIGKAVLVLWPATHSVQIGPLRLPFIPDAGRMRWIR